MLFHEILLLNAHGRVFRISPPLPLMEGKSNVVSVLHLIPIDREFLDEWWKNNQKAVHLKGENQRQKGKRCDLEPEEGHIFTRSNYCRSFVSGPG